jgi:hypothetical protein
MCAVYDALVLRKSRPYVCYRKKNCKRKIGEFTTNESCYFISEHYDIANGQYKCCQSYCRWVFKANKLTVSTE